MRHPAHLNADLHCHSTASDGTLRPAELVARAIEQGVDLLALTDHDNFDGFAEARQAAADRIHLISGIEFSAVWKGITLHIVGLDFEPEKLQLAVERQKVAREKRSQTIAERLEKRGVKNALEGAQRYATSDNIGRPHFARYLVAQGHFKTEADAFDTWLGAGKIGDVKANWPDIQTIVGELRQAGGQAVLAHPHHYRMTNGKLSRLLAEFKECGGAGIEVCVSGMRPEQTAYFASLCEKFGFMGSRGSDFHSPENQWTELGRVAPLPAGVSPIWQSFIKKVEKNVSTHDINQHPIHLGLGATADVEPRFTGAMEWYEAYSERHAADGAEGRLVSMHSFTASWSMWEMHPKGSEVVLCIAGAMTLHQENPAGSVTTVELQPGQYAINAPGVWHTADVSGEATALFITAGEGTLHRPR